MQAMEGGCSFPVWCILLPRTYWSHLLYGLETFMVKVPRHAVWSSALHV